MDIIPFLKKESALWKAGVELVQKRRQAWVAFEKKARNHFNSIVTEAKTQGLYDNLYVQTTEDIRSIKLPNFITLFWGQHPTGEFEFEGERKGRMVFERGCALHLSQLPSGEVIATFYPYQSTTSRPSKEYYVYKLYGSPDDISDKDIQWLVRIMFSLARSTTFARKVTLFDRLIITWLKIRTLFRDAWHKEWTNAIMSLLSKALDSKIDDLLKSETPPKSNS
jgi:hypothetical protein